MAFLCGCHFTGTSCLVATWRDSGFEAARSDSDLLPATPLAYVRVLGSKTRRFLQRQHAKVSDACTVHYLSALFEDFPQSAPLFDCCPNVFRRRWNLVFARLGVPTTEGAKGITPKSLRGSGATWRYQVTEDVERIQSRGRWQQRRTLEHYLQEVAGQILLAELSQRHRHKILLLAPAAEKLLRAFTRDFLSQLPAKYIAKSDSELLEYCLNAGA